MQVTPVFLEEKTHQNPQSTPNWDFSITLNSPVAPFPRVSGWLSLQSSGSQTHGSWGSGNGGSEKKEPSMGLSQKIPAAIRHSLEASVIKVPAFNLPYCGAL